MGTSLQQNAERQEKDRYDCESFQSMKAHYEQFNPSPVSTSNSPARTKGRSGGLSEISAGYHIVALPDRAASSAAKINQTQRTVAQKQRHFPQMVAPVRDRPDKIERDQPNAGGTHSGIDAHLKIAIRTAGGFVRPCPGLLAAADAKQ
jgi:hypothetical protein